MARVRCVSTTVSCECVCACLQLHRHTGAGIQACAGSLGVRMCALASPSLCLRSRSSLRPCACMLCFRLRIAKGEGADVHSG
eukprot:5340029-Alexandrium_andersonii.AAC.1